MHTFPPPNPQHLPASAGLRWLKQACLLLGNRRLWPYLFGFSLLQIIGRMSYQALISKTPWPAWGERHQWSWQTLHFLAESQIDLLLFSLCLLLVCQQQATGRTNWRRILPPLRRRYPALAGIWLLIIVSIYIVPANGISAFLSEVRSLSPDGQFIAELLILSLLLPVQCIAFLLFQPLMLDSVPAKQAIAAGLRAARLNWQPLLIIQLPFWLAAVFVLWMGSGLFAFDGTWFVWLDSVLLPLLLNPFDPPLLYLAYRDIFPTHAGKYAFDQANQPVFR